MRPCFHVEIETPKKVLLNGLWFGPPKAKTVYIWVHGLSSTIFSKLDIVDELRSKDTAVLTFNNRGHDQVATVSTTSGKRIRGGSAHEKFTDSVDDIEGAIRMVRKNGAQRVFLVGHSTGCQKSVYWGMKKGKGVKGIILLAPISDYAATVMLDGKPAIKRAMSVARRLIRAKRQHELLPENVWSQSLLADAQRFVSLYGGSGPEEIFTYWDPERRPKALQNLRLPVLALLAERDEYADRPAAEMAGWFLKHIYEGEVDIVPATGHAFKGAEAHVARAINRWASEL